MIARLFAVLAAAFLVIAVGLAALTPIELNLAGGLLQLNSGVLKWLQLHSAEWAWTWVVAPFLQRPMWLVPAFAGLICAGLALTFNLGTASPSRRRRS